MDGTCWGRWLWLAVMTCMLRVSNHQLQTGSCCVAAIAAVRAHRCCRCRSAPHLRDHLLPPPPPPCVALHSAPDAMLARLCASAGQATEPVARKSAP